MKIVGLITEYNPFHNGHKYHIEKAKEITGADYAVVIMSGDYVQRGTPAIMPKRLRAQMALQCGADAVFELPISYSSGSAEYFAEGAVSFLDKLGIVDYLCFGSESNDLPGLQAIADILLDEPAEYKILLQEYLKNGLSFPAARQKSLSEYLNNSDLSSLLNDPNNILGIEYLKALKKFGSSVIPVTILRQGAHYHDENISEIYSSASAIRSLYKENILFSELQSTLADQVPSASLSLLEEHYQKSYPVSADDFSLLLKYRLLEECPESLLQYMDISEELANRIYNHLSEYMNFNQFCELLKTRELTHARIQRALIHIILKLTKESVEYQRANGYHFYAHLLGFQKDAAVILSEISKNSALPLVTKVSDAGRLSDYGQEMLKRDVFASNLYASVCAEKYKMQCRNEYQYPVLKI